MKLLLVVLLNCHIPFAISLTANLTYAGCRPPNDWAFSFKCAQDQVTWVADALFGKTIDLSVDRFCDNPLPNRTAECISQRPINTRDVRLACNTVRGPCQPNGPAEIIHDYTFANCSSSSPMSFTYAYAVYDCLPAFIDYVYVDQTQPPKTSTAKVYLMSAGYDSKGYTTSPVNRCSVRVSSSALSTVRISVLDLLGQTAGFSAVSSCPYTLSIGAAGYSRVWCAQPTWDYFGTYTLDVPANSGAQQIDVNFNAASDAVSAQGRFWILVEGLTSDGNAASIEINSGGIITASTVRTTPTPATTSTTTTTTATTATTTATTTTPTTTSSTATTTTTTTRMTTRVTSSTSSSTAVTAAPSIATTQSRSTIGQPTIIITTISTAATPLATKTTVATATTTLMIPVSSIPTTPPSLQTGSRTNWPDTNSPISTGSTLEDIAAVEAESDWKTSSYVIAVAVGVSFVGIVLLCVAVPVIVCLCMYCSDRKHRSKIRRRPAEPIPDRPTLSREETLTREEAIPVRSADPSAVFVEETQPTDETHRDGTYSKIEDVGVTIIHTGTIGSNAPSTVEHRIKVRFNVGGGKVKQKRLKRRPRELDEAQWDSPPSYSDRDTKAAHNNRPSSGEPVPKVQRNPIFGEEDYNY